MGVFVGVSVTVGVLVFVGVAVGASTRRRDGDGVVGLDELGDRVERVNDGGVADDVPLAVATKPVMMMVRVAPPPVPIGAEVTVEGPTRIAARRSRSRRWWY